jgi:hypothetical protein
MLFLQASLSAPSWADGVHALRAAQIAAINANASIHWRAAAQPRFAALAPGASAYSNGVHGDSAADIREAIAKGEIEPFIGVTNAEIPDEFDSETHWPACSKSARRRPASHMPSPPSLKPPAGQPSQSASQANQPASQLNAGDPFLPPPPCRPQSSVTSATRATAVAAGHSLAPRRRRIACASPQAAR